ncbi:MAG: DNA gyrase subunit A, partial [Clostridia bacterium]|nr:DNA gyrase subunit A [Clostridia bacterium]
MNVFTEGQNIRDIEIDKEVKTSFIDYSMSVIVDRALPDVRDGLKPVHRRILYSMYDDGLTYDKPFRKSATTVGNVLGHYHPHGDAAVYDTMVRMAQNFSLRYPLIDGQGNFGNVDGDGAAAYRYTEARLQRIANEMMVDIEKDVVDFMPNFDNKAKEPTVLPSRFPNLLVNGSIGIAVGMATNIPSHNMREVIDGTIFLMENPNAEVADIMQYIKGPDFPTAGTIYGTAGIAQAYMTGKGHIIVRAKTHIEENKNRTSIIVTEIPYQVNKSMLVASIADLVKDKRIEGIADLRDESSLKTGMRIVIDLKRDANPQIILNLLYKYTRMQDTFAINMLALVDNEPKTLNLKQILNHYIAHQISVIRRRTE